MNVARTPTHCPRTDSVRTRTMRTCFALLLVGLFAVDDRESWTTVSAAAHVQGDRPDLPANITLHDTLKDVVLDMLQGSNTFRQQCRRLGMIRELVVRISLEPETRWGGRAQCNATGLIKRYRYGRIEADVRLLTLTNVPSLIAHELEHIREYVEGMNFLATSVQYPRRVWMTPQGHYETARAIEAGDQVASEMARHRSRQSTTTLARRAP